jgi:hypothetical protein
MVPFFYIQPSSSLEIHVCDLMHSNVSKVSGNVKYNNNKEVQRWGHMVYVMPTDLTMIVRDRYDHRDLWLS